MTQNVRLAALVASFHCNKHRQRFKYEDTDTYVYAFPDSSEYTIGIIVDPCQVNEIRDRALVIFVAFYYLRVARWALLLL